MPRPSASPGAPRLRVRDLSFGHPDAPGGPLLEAVSVELGGGWTGVVGPNGAGKSTLLRLIAGDLRPDRGRLERDPREGRVALCPQRVDDLDSAIEALAWDWGPEASRWRARLDLEPEALARWPTLSPGERKRWQIGAALAEDPEILLLDEPSNHLDGAARGRLVEALRAYSGVGVLVSHDRALLDGLCSTTLCVRPWRIFPGPYAAARAAWEAEDARARARWDAADARLDRVRARLHETRADRASAERQNSSSVRMKGPRDHDARGSLAKGKAASGERAAAREVSRVGALVERAEAARDSLSVRRDLGSELVFRDEPAPRPRLLHLATPTLEVGGQVLVRDVDLSLDRGARLRLHGPNGAGKTTLIRALLANSDLPEERILVLPQELSAEQGRALLERCLALPRETQGRLMQILAALGVDPALLRVSSDPSPGEVRKLAIALGLARGTWLLVLDEPTNHLDLPSIERLEAALSAWPGALLLVTHDDGFATALGCETWEIRDRRLYRWSPQPREP